MLRSRANPSDTVHAYLKRNGPMTLSELASHTGLELTTVRCHLTLHKDAYAWAFVGSARVRTWSVIGDIT